MRILIVHNFYGSSAPSGENQAVTAEQELLITRGHDVRIFRRDSDILRALGPLGLAAGALATPWNPWSAFALRQELDRFEPDVVHVHNTFPLISPSIFREISPRAACVLTLHNYRMYCAAGIPMRDGQVCTTCLDERAVLPAIRHRCYRSSTLATLPLAANISLHRRIGTWRKHIHAFVALSSFQKDLLTSAGLDEARIHIKPNFFPGMPDITPWSRRPGYVVFAGRLTREKGVASLVQAWNDWGPSAPLLKIVGDGELREVLEASSTSGRVLFAGQLAAEDAQREIANAHLLVVPSQCIEGFPMVIREAFAFGTPVACSNLGPLPHIVTERAGATFEPGNARAILESVVRLWTSPDLLNQLGIGARVEFERAYTDRANYDALMRIYDRAIVQHGELA